MNRLWARLYFDEDADVCLAEALKQRGWDVRTTVEAGLLEAADADQLDYAVSQQRVLVTHNIRHFPALHALWRKGKRLHWGIIVLIGHAAPGIWLRRMERVLQQFPAGELQSRLIFLGAAFDR